ncbi:hypothetical protein ScalyP_jg1400 [Parmales sp. scaly parma]|nr:hypothetical protein ScalyP_jg1400 [Parmales sp. scaly parma]
MFGDTFGSSNTDYSKGMLYSVRNSYTPKGTDEHENVTLAPPDNMFLSRAQANKNSREIKLDKDLSGVLNFGSPDKSNGQNEFNKHELELIGEKKHKGSTNKFDRNGKRIQFEEANEDDADSADKLALPTIALISSFGNRQDSKQQKLKETARKNAEKKKKEALRLIERAKMNQWSPAKQAGCKFFQNNHTGEATTDNPAIEREEGVAFKDLAVCRARIREGEGHGEQAVATGAMVYDEVRGDVLSLLELLERGDDDETSSSK